MDKKTVGEISIQKAFNKKWWDSNRSSKIKGTGTGALLDTWKKTYSDKPAKFSTAEIAATRKASETLLRSLKEALKLCGTTQPDDLAGIKKMMGLLETYESLLEDRAKEITKLSETLERSITTYNNAKPALLQVGKDLTDVDTRVKQIAKRMEKPLSENAKKEVLQLLQKIEKDLDKLQSDAGQATGKANDFDSVAKLGFDGLRKDKGLRPVFERYDTMKAGFFEIGDRLHDQILALTTDVKEMARDAAGTATIDSTVKLLEQQDIMVKSMAFNEYNFVLDLAKEWLPKLILAKKKPETVSQDTIRELMVLEEMLTNSTRMGVVIEGQISRVMKQSTKAASRFKEDQSVDKALQKVKDSVKLRLDQRAKMVKVKPALQKEVQEVLSAAL